MTLRDQYILAQALVLGIEALAAVKPPHREESNLRDMIDLAARPGIAPFTTAILASGQHSHATALINGAVGPNPLNPL